MSNTQNVSTAKPKIGGSLYTAPLGTKLPTTATETLDPAFSPLGYISEDGVTNTNTPKSDTIKAWGGDVVAATQSEKEDSFQYTLIEATNIDVLKETYGPSNVSGDLDKGIEIKANATELPEHVIVGDMILKGGILKRIVIPNAKVTEVGDITYGDEDPIGYETTLTAIPDGNANSHYEYIQKPGAETPPEQSSMSVQTSNDVDEKDDAEVSTSSEQSSSSIQNTSSRKSNTKKDGNK